MRTTIDLPDALFRRCKATAALRGTTLKELVTDALRRYLEHDGGSSPEPRGWRCVDGLASPEDLAPVDAAVDADLERVDPGEWERSPTPAPSRRCAPGIRRSGTRWRRRTARISP